MGIEFQVGYLIGFIVGACAGGFCAYLGFRLRGASAPFEPE